jgi:hypothetical protein
VAVGLVAADQLQMFFKKTRVHIIIHTVNEKVIKVMFYTRTKTTMRTGINIIFSWYLALLVKEVHYCLEQMGSCSVVVDPDCLAQEGEAVVVLQ